MLVDLVLPVMIHGLFLQAILIVLPIQVQRGPAPGNVPAITDAAADDTADVGGVPVGIYKEDEETQCGHVREWVVSGRMQSDIFFFVSVYMRISQMIGKELHTTSREWEEEQQTSFIRCGIRSSMLLERYRCTDENLFLDQMASLVFDGDCGFEAVPFDDCTEALQPQSYVIPARAAIASYLLTVVKQRWFPT